MNGWFPGECDRPDPAAALRPLRGLRACHQKSRPHEEGFTGSRSTAVQKPAVLRDRPHYLKAVDEIYVNDAYHSLSIEGYRVSPELIQRVRTGTWNPDENPEDRENRNALAARGYFDAFFGAKASVEKVLGGTNAGRFSRLDHRDWYRPLFGPSVAAGILRAADLAGYRTGPVYIRRSKQVPPPRDTVRDCMPVLLDLLANDPEPAVRVVLGHFVFVYIHPYMDGNGRMGRFLMNVMLASGGYPRTVIPLERWNDYMAALEGASVGQDVRAFARFVGDAVEAGLHGRTARPLRAGATRRRAGTVPLTGIRAGLWRSAPTAPSGRG